MNKTVASVIDDINEWENPRAGYVYYVTAMFSDESVGSVGKLTKADAETVQAQLRDAIGEELDFTLEPKKPTKSGRVAWKITGFGVPGEEPAYTAPGVQGGGAAAAIHVPRGRSPEHDVDASIRAAVALKAAASFLSMTAVSMERVLEVAEFFEEWLQRKASEPASSAYNGGGLGTVTPPSTPQAGAGSEDLPQETRPQPADSAGLVDSGDGEAPESTPHEHDWQPHPQLRGKLKCECGAMRNKVA